MNPPDQPTPMLCPHCKTKLLWSDDRGAHCDGCDDFDPETDLPPTPDPYAHEWRITVKADKPAGAIDALFNCIRAFQSGAEPIGGTCPASMGNRMTYDVSKDGKPTLTPDLAPTTRTDEQVLAITTHERQHHFATRDLARTLERELSAAKELLREIRDHEVDASDEADKFLRDHQPSALSAAKAECKRLRFLVGPQALSDDPVVAAYAELARLRAEVERWQTVAAEMSAEREHSANEASRIRAEVERQSQVNAEVVGEASRQVAASDSLYRKACAELARLRAENLTVHQMACAAALERDSLRDNLAASHDRIRELDARYKEAIARLRAEVERYRTMSCVETLLRAEKAEAVSEGRLKALNEKADEARREWLRAERAESALHQCYTATGEEAGDSNDFRALEDRERHTVEAVKAMRAERDALAKALAIWGKLPPMIDDELNRFNDLSRNQPDRLTALGNIATIMHARKRDADAAMKGTP